MIFFRKGFHKYIVILGIENSGMNICIIDRGMRIPAITYGGTERVIWGLGKELSEMGHNVTFIVPEGSVSDFARVIIRRPDTDINTQIPEDTDIVHLSYRPETPLHLPYVVTMHGNPASGEVLDHNTIFISGNQAARHNSDVYVYNGLLWEEYPEPDLNGVRDSFHFLGKASWKVKNAVGAMSIAQRMNAELQVIGGRKWNERNLKSALPYLFNRKIKFHGFLNDRDKYLVMQRSKALIFPVLWHEPFGLAIIESLYAGCAVFGTANGSLPELIPSDCGFTGNTSEEMIAAIQAFDYNPQRCHDYAVEKFSAKVMAKNYLKYYEKVISGEQLHPRAPAYNRELNSVPAYH